MTDSNTERAYDDLDEIAAEAEKAMNKIAVNDVDGTEESVRKILETASAWEDE